MNEEKKVPTIDELIALPTPANARISPDGEWVAYTVTSVDWKQNEYISQLWLVSAQGGEPRQLTFAGESSTTPRWSPDGRWLAFLSRRKGDEHTQVYRMSPFGGEAERLTEHEADVSAYDWAPDGKAIAFIAPDAEGEVEKEREEAYGAYHVEDEDFVRSHLWMLRFFDKKILKLTHGKSFHVVDFDWNPQRYAIAFEAWPSPDQADFDRGKIYLIDLRTLGITLLTEESCSTPRWSPEGERLAYVHLGSPTYIANNTLHIIHFGSMPSEKEVLTASEASIGPRTANVLEASAFEDPAPQRMVIQTKFDEELLLEDWSLAGIYASAIQRTTAHLFRVDATSGEVTCVTPLDQPGWMSFGASFSKDFSRAALVAYDNAHYAEVVVLETESLAPTGEQVKRLTDFTAQTQNWKLGTNEVVQWKSSDGTEIEGVLTWPPDYDPEKKYPLLVVIHGGPTWVSFQGRLANGYERRMYPIHTWAARGAIILQPNYRGSAGYGEAFRSLNVRNLGLGDCADVVSGVDALVERGLVDPERVGVMGWSQGGYISAFCTTYTSERFRAASVGAGISNWITYYANTDIHPFTRQYLKSNPWEDMQVYQETSPMTYIRRAKTPTLIQHGESDRRVPLPNAYELYQGLRDMGVEARLVTYPGMPHGPTKPRTCRQIMQENLNWFNRWIWDEPTQVAETSVCYVALGGLEKPGENGDMPAYIQEVIRAARRDRTEFCLFSPQVGLVRSADSLLADTAPLEPEAIATRARQVAEQLRAEKIRKLVVFLPEGRQDSISLTGLGCLHLAAGMAGDVRLEQRTTS